MKKSMLIIVLLAILVSILCGCTHPETTYYREPLTDEQLVKLYIHEEYGENCTGEVWEDYTGDDERIGYLVFDESGDLTRVGSVLRSWVDNRYN